MHDLSLIVLIICLAVAIAETVDSRRKPDETELDF